MSPCLVPLQVLCLGISILPLSLKDAVRFYTWGHRIVGGLLFNELYFEKECQGWVAILHVSFYSEPFRV